MSQSKLMDFNAIFFARARVYISETCTAIFWVLVLVFPAFAAPLDVPQAIANLKSADLKTQYAALEILKAVHTAEVAVVVAEAAVRERDVNFRLTALDQVAVHALPQVIPTISPLLRDPRVAVRQRTARVIGMLGTPAAERALVDALRRERDTNVKAALMQGLSLCGSDTSAEAIEAAMRNAPREVRANGVGALRRMRGPKSTAALEKARADKDLNVRKMADDEVKERTRKK